jgi:SAM-dependent MidA family methyltransferase
MGRQLAQWWEKLGRPAHFVVLEQGAGRGDLARGIQAWARSEASDFQAALDYRVEDLRQGQDSIAPLDAEILRFAQDDRDSAQDDSWTNAQRHISTPILHVPTAPSVILSNELIDAFPVHIVETRDQRLYEVYVDVQEGRLYEVLGEPSTDEVGAYLDSYAIPWRSFGDGWRAEINLDALRWMRRTAQLLRRGYLLAIDYGDKAKALYTKYRRHGTLACYFQHQVNERPLARPGEQDITAHVNFSALIDEGRRQGLHLNTFTTQRLWLAGLGIQEELEHRRMSEFAESVMQRATDRGQVALLKWRDLSQRVAALTDPTGMGNFKVLILRR